MTNTFEIPKNGVEADNFSPHEYEEGDVVYIVMPEQTMIFSFNNKKGQDYYEKWGRPARCTTNIKDGNGMWSFGKSVYRPGDSLVVSNDDGDVSATAYYGPIQKIVLVAALVSSVVSDTTCPCD